MKPWLRLTLITLTVGGGFTGFVQTLWPIFDPENQESIYQVIMMAFLLLYAFVTLSGLLFVQNHQRITPLRYALWLQVPWISSPVITYQFVSGFHFTVGLQSGYINADFWLGSGGQFYLFSEFPWGFGVNIFALLLIFLLRRSIGVAAIAQSSAVEWAGLPQTFVDEIDQILQRRLTQSDIRDCSVHVHSEDDGNLAISVNNVYRETDSIKDATLRHLIQEAIDEWQTQKERPVREGVLPQK